MKQKVYIGDKISLLLGMPRLRQLRIQKGISSLLVRTEALKHPWKSEIALQKYKL